MANEIRAKMSLNNSGFIKGLEDGKRRLDGFKASIKNIGATIVGAMAINEITQQMGKLVDRATEIRDRSQEIGVDTGTFQKLQFFLEQSSGKSEQLSSAFRSIARNRERALGGDVALLAAFDKLGISAERLKSARVEDVFFDIADAVRTTDTQSLIDPLTRIAETEVTKIIPALKTDLRALFDEAESRGILISQEEIDKISALGDQLLTLKRQFQSLAADIGTPAIEALTGIVRGLQDVVGEMVKANNDLLTSADAFGDITIRQESPEAIRQLTPIDQSKDLRDQLIVKFVEDRIGNRDRDRVVQRAEEIKVALGDQFDALELDDEGLIRSNEQLETALRQAVSALTTSDFERARLDIATGGRSVGQVVQDQRQNRDERRLETIRAAVGDERFDEVKQAIDTGAISLDDAFQQSINEVRKAGVTRAVEARQRETDGTLVNQFGGTRVVAPDTSEFEASLQVIIDTTDARLSELRKIIDVSPESADLLKPQAEQLIQDREQALGTLRKLSEFRQQVSESAIRSTEQQGISGAAATIGAAARAGEILARGVNAGIDRNTEQGREESDTLNRNVSGTVKGVAQTFGDRGLNVETLDLLNGVSEAATGLAVDARARAVIAERRRQDSIGQAQSETEQLKQVFQITTDDQTEPVELPADTTTTQTVVTDDQTEEPKPKAKPAENKDVRELESISAGAKEKIAEKSAQTNSFDFARDRRISDLQSAGIFSRGYFENNPGGNAQQRQLDETVKQTELLQRVDRGIQQLNANKTQVFN